MTTRGARATTGLNRDRLGRERIPPRINRPRDDRGFLLLRRNRPGDRGMRTNDKWRLVDDFNSPLTNAQREARFHSSRVSRESSEGSGLGRRRSYREK